MSIKLMHEVYGKELDHAKQAVLLAMADHADDDGYNCFPSMDRVAYKTGYKPRNVIRVVSELREMGALVVIAEATAQKPTEYRIRLSALRDKPPFGVWRAEHGRAARRGAIHAPVQNEPQRDAKSGRRGVAPRTPKQSVKPLNNRKALSEEKMTGAQRRRAGYEWLFGEEDR